jgi:hypothetical protein
MVSLSPVTIRAERTRVEGDIEMAANAEKLSDDLLSAQAQHLPQFAERAGGRGSRGHGRMQQ